MHNVTESSRSPLRMQKSVDFLQAFTRESCRAEGICVSIKHPVSLASRKSAVWHVAKQTSSQLAGQTDERTALHAASQPAIETASLKGNGNLMRLCTFGSQNTP